MMINDRYEILKEIGTGGIGKVLKAIDRFRQIPVAIKVLLSQKVELIRGFKEEFLLLKKLDHPNIVKVYDFGFSESGEPYFTMEYIQGEDWKGFLQPLDYSKFFHLILQICTTLDFLHSKRIIHGDLKPSNILIRVLPDGSPSVKFTDFGFAEPEKPKESAWWKGTLCYLAPEIIRGEKHGHQADLYSLGVLIYEALFGMRPFEEEKLAELARSHLEKEVAFPRKISLPTGLKDLILKLLEKDPIDRFFSAKEVLSEVEKISGSQISDLKSCLERSLISSVDFIGRDEELAILREAFDQTSASEGRLVLLSGESGMGKTELMEEFQAWVQIEDASVTSITLAKGTSPERIRQIITDPLEDGPPRPLVWIFEHLESADDLCVDLLCSLISRAQNKKILICMTLTTEFTRSEKDKRTSEIEEKIKFACKGSIIPIRLQSLRETQTKELLCSMFRWKEKEDEISTTVHRRTGGNPLLIRQLMEWLVSNGQIHRENAHWMVKLEEIDAAPVPPWWKEEMAGRLNRLTSDERDLIWIASVLGLEFEMGLLGNVCGLDYQTLRRQLESVLLEQILQRSTHGSDEEEIRFLNGFTRDFIYEQIDREKRKALHQMVGRYMEDNHAAEMEGRLDQLADHFYQARDNLRAVKYAVLAAKKAEGSGKRNQAIRLYLRVLELSDQCLDLLPMPQEEIFKSLAEQYEGEGNYPQSLHFYQKALELWKIRGADQKTLVQIYRRMARIYAKTSEHENVVILHQQALRLSDQADMAKEHASVLIDLAWHHRIKCEYDKAVDYLKGAISALKDRQVSKEMGEALSCLGTVHWYLGNYPEAFENLSKGLEVFGKLDQVQKEAECYIALGLILRSQGRPLEALEYSQKALAALETLSDTYRLSVLENNLSLTYMDLNRWDQALESLCKSLELKKQVSDLKGLGLSHNNMALIYLRKGLFDKSFEHLTAALYLFREIRDGSGVTLAYHNLGDWYRCKEDFRKALHYLERSLKIAKKLGEQSRVADCLLLLGKTEIEQSEFDHSRESLNQALKLFTQGKNGFGEAETQLALGELALRMEDFPGAEEYLNRARPYAESAGNKWFEGRFKRAYAFLLGKRGDQETCGKLLFEAADSFKKLGARFELGKTYLKLGKIKLKIGRIKEGKALLREALSIFEKSEIEGKRKEVEALLNQTKKMQPGERERIRTLYRLAELLNSIWDTDELLSKALDLVMELMNAERGAVILHSERDKSFELKISKGLEPETSEDAIAISQRVLSDVMESDSPLIVENATTSPQFANSKSVILHNILSILCVPLRTEDRIIGTVYLDHRSLPAVFSSEDVDFLNAFACLIATAIEKSELYVTVNEEIFQLKESLHRSYQYPHIIGNSSKMQEIFNLVEKVANSKTSVLITGENGTGKELIAHLTHSRSSRRDGPFIRVNCAALPETLLESELFGIEEKTATGVGFRKGKFELADGGTIFLDEIGDMALSVQAKVLRVLQEKEFERVGGQKPIKVDIRIISATNMDLQRKVEEGTFRRDLFFRLNPIVITIPPLCERKEDIPYLVQYFAQKFSKENGKPEVKPSKRINSTLENYSWPGNVRELEHVIERATLLSRNGEFPREVLPEETLRGRQLVNLDKYGTLQEVLNWVEKRKIIIALEKNQWNQVRAAEELGLNETTLRRRIKKHKIKKVVRIKPS